MTSEHILETINKWSATTIKQIHNIPESHLNRIIAGQLRSCIKAHGNITPELIGSAAKRIANSLLGEIEMHKQIHISTNKLQPQQQATIMESLEKHLRQAVEQIEEDYGVAAKFNYYTGEKANVDITFEGT